MDVITTTGWCSPKAPLNTYPIMLELTKECEIKCLEEEKCRFLVWDAQRGYCYLFDECLETFHENGVPLVTMQKTF